MSLVQMGAAALNQTRQVCKDETEMDGVRGVYLVLELQIGILSTSRWKWRARTVGVNKVLGW